MGIFGRMKTLLKANVNDLASKAEDPEKVLNQLILDMEDQLRKAKLQVRDAITDRKRLEKQLEAARIEADKWEKKAMTAVEAGRDDLAREALGRKQEQEELAAGFQTNLEQQASMVDDLRDSLRGLSDKIEEAKRKKATLVARMKRIEATNATEGTVASLNNTSAFDSFERSAAKIEDFEAEVEAHGELASDRDASDLEAKFRNIEKGHGNDDALAALKAKMARRDDD